MRTNILRQKRLLLLLGVVTTAIILLVLFLGTLNVASPAYAITDTPYYSNGASIDFVIDTETYSVSYNNVLDFSSASATTQDGKYVFGYIYSENYNLDAFESYTTDGAKGFAITSAVPNGSVWYVDMEIDPNGNLARAIRDNLIKVTLQPYFIWGSVAPDGGGETGQAELVYYTGTRDGSSAPESEGSAPVTINYAGSPGDNNTRLDFAGYTLPNVCGTDAPSFVRLKFYDYTLGGNGWNTIVKEMGVTVTCAFDRDLSAVTSSVEIIDYTGLRSPEAADNLVKAGDTVVIRSDILAGVSTLNLNTKNAGATPDSVNGDFYRRLFMHNLSGTLLRYKFSETEFTQIYSYKDALGATVDISGDYSGKVAAFTVLRTTAAHLQINTRLYNADTEAGFLPKIDNFYADNSAAAQPYLDVSDAFYKKYVGTRNTAYYTNEASYVKDNVDVEGNGVLVNTVVAVDLGQGASIPRFTADALAIAGAKPNEGFYGSSQIMYYRVTVLKKAPSVNGEKSEGFEPAEATGVYCNVLVSETGVVSVFYDKLILPLAWEEEVDGVNKTVYHNTGMYSIEFVTVDYAGNKSFCPQKFYVKVDISDYEFTYQNYINSDGNTSVDSYVTISFAKLDDNNNLSSRFTTPVFKRGDRVLVYVRFTNDGFSRYILTQFALPGGNNKINTTNNEYDSSRQTAIAQSSTTGYTFEVNSLFEDPRLRSFTLTYKNRAILSVSNKTQAYNGTGRSLSVVLKDASGNSVTGNVSITYATDVDGPYSSTLPIDAGTYYYRCELLNHLTYYGYTSSVMEADILGNPSTFVIRPVEPYIEDIRISQINYGDSLKRVDFDPDLVTPVFNQSVQVAGADGIYYSDRSSDSKGMYRIGDEYRDLGCIYGYYMISDIDEGTYNNPAAGNLSLTIKFVPIVMTYDEGSGTYTPQLRRGADNKDHFVEDNNYASIKVSNVVITINHSTAVAYEVEGMEDDVVSYDYDGTAKAPRYSVTSTLSGESGTRITDYTRLTFEEELASGYGAATTEPPVNAGVYRVTVTILSARCNYTGEEVFTLIVNKRRLNVEGYESAVEFRYQEEQPLTPTASYGEIGDKIYYNGLNYSFTYYNYDGGLDNSTSAIEANLVDPSEIYAGTGMPENVGTYVVKIEINERNYANAADKYARFSIKPVDGTYTNLTLTAPTLSYNSNTREAHLNYLQPLSFIKFGTNANTGVKFVFHVMDPVTGRKYTEIRNVEGYFVLSYRLFRSAGYEAETMSEFADEVSLYDEYAVGRHTAYIYFIPTGSFARNFLPVYRETEVTVGRAVLNLDDVTIQDIIYGTRVSGIDDLTVDRTVKILIREINAGGDVEVEYFLLNACADNKSRVCLSDNKITVEFCADNAVFTAINSLDPDLCTHSKAKIFADRISSFDELSASFADFVEAIGDATEMVKGSASYNAYEAFVTDAKALYDNSVLNIARNVNVDPDKGAVLFFDEEYAVSGTKGYRYFVESDPDFAHNDYYELTGGNYVLSEDTVKINGKTYYRRNTYEELTEAVAALFGSDNVNVFFDALFAIYSAFNTNAAGADFRTIAKRLRYDGAVYTADGLFVMPYVFKNDKLNTPVLAYLIVDVAATDVYMWISDIDLAFKTANYRNVIGVTDEETDVTLHVYGRCELFEVQQGYTYTLLTVTDGLYSAGEHYIDIKVTPTDTTYFAPVTVTKILNVRKRVLSVKYKSDMSDANVTAFDNMSRYFDEVMASFTLTDGQDEWTMNASSPAYASYGYFFNYAKYLFDNSRDPVTKNINYELSKGIVAGLNNRFWIYGEKAFAYFAVSEPAVAEMANYYELVNSDYVLTQDASPVSGKSYYRRNTYGEFIEALAILYGLDVAAFTDEIDGLVATFTANDRGADDSSLTQRLVYEFAIYTRGSFVVPLAFKSNKLAAPVLAYLIFGSDGLASVYVNDVEALFRTANYNNILGLSPGVTATIKGYYRTELFGDARSEYVFTYGGVTEPTPTLSLPVTVTGETRYYDRTTGSIVADLRVGECTAVFTIVDDNYEGVGIYDIVVNKDVLTIDTVPSIYNQTAVVAYNELMDNVNFYNGVMRASNTGASVAGRFYFHYPEGTRFTDTGVRKSYRLIFIPDDAADYETYDEDDLVLNLTVSKANISSGISMNVMDGFYYGDLSADDDLTAAISYSTTVRKDAEGHYNYDNDPAYDYLEAAITFDGLPATGLLNADDYTVTLTIDDVNYTGSTTGVLHVAKKAAKIVLSPDANGETNVKIFRNRNQNVSYAVLTDDVNEDVVTTETVTQVFYLNGIRQQTMPSEIGKYRAILTLVSNNYFADALNTDFTIKVDPAQIRVTNLDQTYNVPRAVVVSLGLNDAVYSLSYVDVDTHEEFFTLPTDAGEYEVRLTFAPESNDGYAETITYTENGAIRYLVINKYNATITVPDVITVTYTGNSYDPRPTTEPYGLTIVKEYKAQGASEYSDVEVLDANVGDGYHFIRFSIVDDNFTCVKEVRYRINPAALTIIADPSFGEYVYNSDVPPALLTEGMVNFGAVSDVEGEYSFVMSDINSLAVGNHTVRYVFTATAGGDVNNNFVPVEGQVTLSTVKKAIDPSDIVIGEVSGNSAYYDGSAHAVDARITDGLVYDPTLSNADFRVVVYYNGNANAPRDPGAYTVRAVVSSKNYSGEKTWEETFTINKGIPHIVSAPTFIESSYAVNTVLTTNDLTVGSGRAVIEGTDNAISGEFSVVDALLNRANYNQVLIEFTPGDADRFEEVSCYVSVFAIGSAPLNGVNEGENWDDKVITVGSHGTVTVVAYSSATVYYGAKLSAFTLKFVGDSEAVEYLSDFGSLSFVEPDAVPEAGSTQVRIKFTPYDAYASEYTITTGYVSVTVAKSDLAGYSVELKGYYGKTIGEIEFIAKDLSGNVIELNGSATYYDGDMNVIPADTVIDASLIGTTAQVTYIFVDDNYNDLSGGATLSYVYELAASNIEVGKDGKSYDGRAIDVSDLDISVTNVSVSASAEDITIMVYDAEGRNSDGVDVGTYKVVITVSNSVLYGVKTVDFTVDKRDVSTDMALDIYSTVYASITAPKAMVDGAYVGEGYAVSIKYKSVSASDASYNVNLPVNAGDYNVKVTVDGPNYSGVKVFDFRVEKLAVRLVADNVYSYRYGNAGIPTVGFRYVDSADALVLSYDLYYYSSSYSMSKTLPSNAGEYVARVVLNAANYSIMGNGYAEFRYIIERMSTTITDPPIPVTVTDNTGSYNVKYGQSLRSLALMGGVASRLDVPVDGYFTVTEPDLMLNAGRASVQVTFVPYDSNYAESYEYVNIVVGKADATVVFDRLQASYTGSSCANALLYTVEPHNVMISVSFRNSAGEVTANPVNAGSYTLQIACNDNNYSIISATDREGNNPIFVIAKAAVRSIVDPKANSLTVGESLLKSSLNSGADYGLVYYVGFDDPIAGNFSFVESSITFTSAGTYEVDYKFTPIDGANYASGRGTTTVTINKATATILVSNNTYTYAEGFRYPTFTTYPANLNVSHDITFREYDPTAPDYVFNADDYVSVGTYEFRAWVDDDNYVPNETVFSIVIQKKALDLDFVDAEGNEVKQYVTTYGVPNTVKFRLYPAGTTGKSGYLQKDEVVNGRNIADLYEIRFKSAQSGETYDDHRAPSNIGSYYVTITLINNNYTATNTIMYKVNRGIIQGVYFDDDSRENQVYGNVTDPIITTVPAGVKYYIVYKGTDGNRLPTDAGSYNMTVYFDDPNYETKQVDAQFRIAKKPVVITKISVENKTFDGITALKISGTIEGILPGDEVALAMTAETADGSAKVGPHYVKITSYVLTGLRAQNYTVNEPQYLQQINITENKITASDTSSFITSTSGFDAGTTVEFRTIATKKNASTFFENVTGRSSTVIGFTVKENGADTLVKDSFKVYLAIPEEYLDCDFEVKGVGALEGKNIVFTREGNYVTFYASSSGQVQFKKTEFRYETVVLAVAAAMAGIGIILLMVLFPLQSRRKFSDNSMEKAYAKRTRGGY